MSDAAREEADRFSSWSRQRIEKALVEAFRAMPSTPVFGAGSRYQAVVGEPHGGVHAVLAWGTLLAHDPTARKCLWAWARCRATGSSFRALCLGLGWSPSTSEVARRRGAAAIAATLNARAVQLRLDNGKGAA